MRKKPIIKLSDPSCGIPLVIIITTGPNEPHIILPSHLLVRLVVVVVVVVVDNVTLQKR